MQQHVTAPLHSVTSPEEKRKIIGDTFIKVANEAMIELELQASQVFLAQGMLGVSRSCLLCLGKAFSNVWYGKGSSKLLMSFWNSVTAMPLCIKCQQA